MTCEKHGGMCVGYGHEPWPEPDAHPYYHEACDKCWQRYLAVLRRAEVAEKRLRLAKAALVATGYFTESEVGDDIAPRIIEMTTARTPDDAA